MFIKIFLLNSFALVMSFACFCYLANQFFKTTTSRLKQIILTISSGMLLSLSITLLTIQQINTYGSFEGLIQIAINILIYMFYIGFSKLIFQNSKLLQMLLLFSIFQMVFSAVNQITMLILHTTTIYTRLFEISMVLANVSSHLFVFFNFYLVIKLFQHLHLDNYLKNLFNQRYLARVIILLFFILDTYLAVTLSKNSALLSFIYFSLVVLISYIVHNLSQKIHLAFSKKIFQQQLIYTNHLEKTEKEIQLIHQNYKHIVEQLYQQSLKKDPLAIKQIIKKEVIKVDQTVSQQLKQMNQLGKIEFIELKGLVLTKIMEAEKKGLNLFVEVQEPIPVISMETSDILRCLGILLDNAIEASIHAEQNFLTLLLLKEHGVITIIVKNYFKDQPPLHQIWQEGFSTKGENRGLGLSNLRQIISNYQNVFQDTRIEQQQFIQILKIKNS